MNPEHHVARLLIDGYTVIPDLLVGRELQELQDAFERHAAAIGSRWMEWGAMTDVPEYCRTIAHPRLMEVIDAFGRYHDREMVVANVTGVRDAFDPTKQVNYDPPNLRHGPVGWHDDVPGMKNPNATVLETTVGSLLYLDETFADNGAYCVAAGSHHLARMSADAKPIFADSNFVLDHCELRPIAVKPGGAILARAHLWHGVVPPRQRRRIFLQGFMARAHYDLQVGHTQFSAASVALIPKDRHKYITSYSHA